MEFGVDSEQKLQKRAKKSKKRTKKKKKEEKGAKESFLPNHSGEIHGQVD